MARKYKRDKNHYREKSQILIQSSTKRLIGAVLASAFAVVLLLAQFQLAGPAGNFIWQTFSFLMGWGYLLLPLAFFAVAIALLRGIPENTWTLGIGIALVVLASLGIVDELRPGETGLIGQTVSLISSLFGFWATIVILGALGISGLAMAFHGAPRPGNKKEKNGASALKEIKEKTSAELLVIEPESTVEAKPQSKDPQPAAKERSARAADEHGENIALSAKIFLKKWNLPPLDLLEADDSLPSAGNVRVSANIIKRALENFGIPVEMSEVNVGPTVTQYTLKPAEGIKLAKIMALQNDLAMALASHPVRIEAPIPGKALVGIEVPNKAAAMVRMRTLFKDAKFFEERSPLTFLLGRDVMGAPVVADLARMPHLMIAGATGSGKSIFIHSLMMSFLFKNPPHMLRFILIDPKRVELSQYRDVPHLLTPVITEGKKAVRVLSWAIKEMDRRYQEFLRASSRDIFAYNAARHDKPEEILPFVIIVIDELADLMAAFGREVEGAIVRLAQMARATGIHLVVSTQRPSVEVITGLIKANITSRVAFQVASQVDSRTILDMAGAEKLLGFGDMLFLAPDTSKPRRIQAPYVTEREIKRAVDFLVKQGDEFESGKESSYAPGLTPPPSLLGGGEEEGQGNISLELGDDAEEWDEDPIYGDAVEVVIEAKKASASLLQRRLKIGYARAARLLDIMEERGVVGPGDGAKPREVYDMGDNQEKLS